MTRLFYIALTLFLITSSQAQEPANWTTKKVTKYINRQLDRVITYDSNGNKLTWLDMDIDTGDTTEYTTYKYNDNNLLQSYKGKYENGQVDYDFKEFKATRTVTSKLDGDYKEITPIQSCGDKQVSIGETETKFEISKTKLQLIQTIYCLGRKPNRKELYRMAHSTTEFAFNDTLSIFQYKSEYANELIKVSGDTVIEFKIQYDQKVDMTYKWTLYYVADVHLQTLYTNYKGKKLGFDINEKLDKQRLIMIEYEYEYFKQN